MRAILNFSHRCALSCEWCYVPFDTPKASVDVVEKIIQELVRLGFTSITFGGGDPFQYKFIDRILIKAKTSGLFVHVDTHGKSLRQSERSRSLIRDTVDLIGLPIDGATANVHDKMRSASGHFESVLQCIDWLGPLRRRLKVNTIVSAKNVQNLPDLQLLIRSIFPARWSLYQYWPLGPAERVVNEHAIDDQQFQQYAQVARELITTDGTVVEVNDQESRRATYPIIHHDGSVFVHSVFPENQLLGIGSIFEKDILEKILGAYGSERLIATTRYGSS